MKNISKHIGRFISPLLPKVIFNDNFNPTLQTSNSLEDKFSQWDFQNETLITHYEKKNRDHAKCFLFWENHVSLRIYLIEL